MILHRPILQVAKMSCCNSTLVVGHNFVEEGKKVLGAGINYYEALKVMNLPKPEKPVIFLKATTSYIQEGQEIVIPQGFEVKEEIELGVIIGKQCKNVTLCDAMDYVSGYCAALDITAFNVLAENRKCGLPWTIGKAFDTSCPVSKFIPKDCIPNPDNLQLFVIINGNKCREGNTKDLIFNVPKLVSYCSQYMTLEPNDLILTGTPPGQMNIYPGDTIVAGIKNVVTMHFNVQNKTSCSC